MSDFTEREEQALLAAIALMAVEAESETEPDAAFGETPMPSDGLQSAQTDEPGEMTLERLYVETLGLLPYALDPVEPAPEQKERLLAAISSQADLTDLTDLTDQASPIASANSTERPVGDVVPFASTRPAAQPAGQVAMASTASRQTTTRFAVAASIVALVMSAAAGWLFTQLQSAEQTVQQLDQQVAELSERERSMRFSRTELSTKVESMSQAMTLMSTPGVEVCPLRPMGEAERASNAHAMLYMAPNNNRWYLRASNLQPMPEGQIYRVWLNTPDGPISVGMLNPGEDAELQFARDRLGERRMLSVTVTIEDDMESTEPQGPMVLFGDEKMQIL